MSPIIDGMLVNAATTNTQLLDAVEDDTAHGKITLANTDAASGAQVDSIQKELNAEASFTGKALNSDKDALPTWTSNAVGVSTDNLKARAEALTAKLGTATNANTAGAIVARDSSGNFSAGTITAALTGAASLNVLSTAVGAANGVASLDSSGLVPITQISPAALERMSVVADQTARYALTTATVQNGDTVKQTDTGELFLIKDQTNLGNANGYQIYSASTAVNFSGNLVGNVTGTQGATVVSSVGGSTAANIHSAELLANAATDANTQDAIMKRDSFGRVNCGLFIGDLQGNATSAGTFSGELTGDVVGYMTGNTVNAIRGVSVDDTAIADGKTLVFDAAETLLKYATVTNANTASAIVKRDASGNFSAGTVTANLTGNASGTAANVTGTVGIDHGGTGQTAKTAAFDALSPNTTKGDIPVHNGTNNVRQAAGSYGQVLTADASTSTGVKWAPAASSANLLPKSDAEDATGAGWGVGTATISGTAPYLFPSGAITGRVDSPATPSASIFTTTNTLPLAGTYSYKYLRQSAGQVVYQNFTVPRELRASVVTVEFSYEITGALADGDMVVGIYSNDDAQWIQPAPFKILGQVGPGKFQGEFQTSATGASYTLAIVQATAGSWTSINLDSFFVGKKAKTFGAPVTDWVAYTPTLVSADANLNLGSTASKTGRYRRVGDSIEVEFNITPSGTGVAGGTGEYSLTIPTVGVIDSSKIPDTQFNTLGSGWYYMGSSAGWSTLAIRTASTTTVRFVNNVGYVSGIQPAGGLAYSGQLITGKFTVPILGWSSSTQMSDSAGAAVVAVSGGLQTPTGTLSAAYNVIKFGTIDKDTTGGYNSTTGLYTVSVPGWYKYAATIEVDGTYGVNVRTGVTVFKNGAGINFGAVRAQASTAGKLCPMVAGASYFNAGDTIGFYSYTGATSPSYNAGETGSNFYIIRESGPSQIAASEKIRAKWEGPTSASFSNNAEVQLGFNHLAYDSHGAMTNGATAMRFTAPRPDLYRVTGAMFFNAAVPVVTSGVIQLYFKKAGVTAGYLGSAPITALVSNAWSVSGTTEIWLNAGEYIEPYIYQTTGTSLGTTNAAVTICNFSVSSQ